MRFVACELQDVRLIHSAPHADDRGRFHRAWCSAEFARNGIDFRPVQANMGYSRRRGTVRGLHYQAEPALEAKLVRCTSGAVFDVVVDLRPESPTRGRWYGTELSAENACMLYVPEHCAHGYQTLRDDSEIHYMTSAFYAPEAVRGVRFDDPAIGIAWPLEVTAASDQDRTWPLLSGHGDEVG
jgi:dTDP-4-dehydrorhamnose 3,5-epimerase